MPMVSPTEDPSLLPPAMLVLWVGDEVGTIEVEVEVVEDDVAGAESVVGDVDSAVVDAAIVVTVGFGVVG